MRLQLLLFFGFLWLVTDPVVAQRSPNSGKSHYTRRYYNYRAPMVRGSKARLVCPEFTHSEYPYHGIGFKLGDPFGFTYKYYANKRFAVVIDFGKPSSALYSRYFREKFPSYQTGSDTLSANASLAYSTHRVMSDMVGEVKFLYSVTADKITKGLKGYIGAGWEWKKTALRYHYFYNLTTPNGGDLLNEPGMFNRTRIAMGPEVVLGIEYAYFELPVSAFMEVELFTDLQADPGWRRFEGGVGLRYTF